MFYDDTTVSLRWCKALLFFETGTLKQASKWQVTLVFWSYFLGSHCLTFSYFWHGYLCLASHLSTMEVAEKGLLFHSSGLTQLSWDASLSACSAWSRGLLNTFLLRILSVAEFKKLRACLEIYACRSIEILGDTCYECEKESGIN